MIRIHKPEAVPEVLRTKGKNLRRGLSSAFTRSAAAYEAGAKKMAFKSNVYGHASVKKCLMAAQFDKCCYCEAKIPHTQPGDVEHFRPKGGWQQNIGEPVSKVGYYWLAYEWDNLLYACKQCNQAAKRNLFPLSNPASRARSHRDRLEAESPLLIHPAKEDPEDFIGFRAEVAFPITGKDMTQATANASVQMYALDEQGKGATTIEALQLNRPALLSQRYETYQKVRMIFVLANKQPDSPESKEALAWLKKAVLANDTEYAAMIRAGLTDNFAY